ncbi:hypothetical protein E2562_018723 [Oryza meyeriana var. granulata]|uniref:Uncharacterized protein n=1 Tax=Oryza meyeriana var. granulata TaxID=110450 RepID=A0A6G1EMQ9_9ORYZ|nr:hypothetical protein E2562_018723 [Oryza meyeriana var. granulata]
MLRARAAEILRRAAGASASAGGARLAARAVFARGFLDRHKMGNKEAIEKEKARLSDEMSRGYFADFSEIRKNAGKLAMANKIIIPEVAAVKFPDLSVQSPDGRELNLPLIAPPKNGDAQAGNTVDPQNGDCRAGDMVVPDASLVCLSFRASSQKMTESWSLPLLDAFSSAGNIQVYEVSFIDSWLLSSSPLRRVFLKVMRKSNNPRRQVVYAFGDHYYFRKKLHILNLLTGYIYLVDRLGRVRWQGFGSATQEELSSLTACASILLDEK